MTSSQDKRERSNRLIDETSPYLLQHAHNPVDWYPWGSEAFAKARQEDKPIFLSVGYSACHWCHVMEHESFENEKIAQILNEEYVAIKVDREERPDVDQIYMTAVQLITKRGGWPMSVFMDADGKPFYGGTYWPPESRMGMPGFRDILLKLADYWKSKRDEVATSADQLVDAIQQMAAPVFQSATLDQDTLKTAMNELLGVVDRKHGGFGGAPKFPHPMDLRVLLRAWKRFDEPEALEVVTFTLDKMLSGGIYDQLGGGFHRYSTDAYWLAPHFEKMLYDNALLVPAYLEAWQATGNPEYRRAVTETLDYVLREMTAPEGGFYATQDADSEGEEGKFFVWQMAEITEILGDDQARIFNAVYDVTPNGNWESKTILNRPKTLQAVADELNVNVATVEEVIERSKATLFDKRSQRVAPGRDDKILVAWNGMMISAMAQAAFVLNEPKYLDAARNAMTFILEHIKDSKGRLLHSFKDGRARFQAYLDDYSCLIDGLIALFESSHDESYLASAISLTDEMIAQFYDQERGGFFYTADDHESLIARTKDVQDNAVPSGNGMAVSVLAKLARLTGRRDYEQVAVQTFEAFSALLAEHPRTAAQMLMAFDFLLGPSQEIVFVAENDDSNSELLDGLRTNFLPNALIVVHRKSTESTLLDELVQGKTAGEDGPRLYLCERGQCQSPVESAEQLKEQIDNLSFHI